MAKVFEVCTLIIILVSTVYGRPPDPRIPFGKPAGWLENNEVFNPGDFPFMVRLESAQKVVVNNTLYKQLQRCGGSIIRSNVIITAAHCVIGVHPENITVQAGIVNTAMEHKSVQRSYLAEYVVHEGFTLEPYVDNDIALLFLADPLNITEFVKPIDLPKKGNYVMGTEVTTFGWGFDENGDSPQWLQKTNLYILPNWICQAFSYYKVSENMICAINQNISTVCRGDSGGPLVHDNHLIGITSWVMATEEFNNGKHSCSTLYPAVFLSVYKYLSWIEDTINMFLGN